MRLISIRIENFGKLHDFDLVLDSGKNVILHDNGYGKTTLATFIKVIFYGFDDEGARRVTRERDKYKPWQGGVYGGTIRFEAGGRTYVLRRTFADKPANDEFELRDTATNIISTDYSLNIGEELFMLDAESFKKAMYIGQNSVMTSTTGRINSHVTTGADALEDLDGFDRAIKAIEDRQNNISERRRTGKLYKKKEELSAIEREITKEESLNHSYSDLCARISDCKSAIGKLKAEEDNLYVKQKEISRKKDLAALKKEYDLLAGAVTATGNKVKEYKAEFKGRIVSEAEVEVMLTRNTELISAKSAADAHKLSEEELRRMDELKAAISRGTEEPEIGHKPVYNKPIMEAIGIIVAILGMAAGAVIMIMSRNYVAGGILIGIGFALLAGSVIFMFARKNKYRMAVATWQAEVAAEKKRLEDLRRLNEMEYDRLSSKKSEYESKSVEALKIREEIAEFLAGAGIVAEANPMQQLLSLQDLTVNYRHAMIACEEAGKKLESFIKGNPDIEEVKACIETESVDELTDINARLKEIDIEEDSIKANLKIYDGNLEELNELFEGIEDAKSRRDV
ncbi:MAG: AAA family ATPase, partial [Lachnospiraceae bacterium]|nr:AAA family ATPase [Lachnospiraceae bacterium]